MAKGGRKAASAQFKGNLKNFDLAATGAGSKKGTERLSKGDVKALLKSGKSAEKIQQYGQGLDTEGGQVFGEGAQKFLQRRIDRQKEKGKRNNPTPVESADPVVSAPVTEQPTGTKPGTPVSGGETVPSEGTGSNQVIDQQNKFSGTNQNTVGGNNYGNLGNQDFSVNIQSTGGGGAGNSSGLSNMESAQAYQGINEANYAKSQALMSGAARADQASTQAEDLVGATDRVKALDKTSDAGIQNAYDMADRSTLGVFGDIWNMTAPEWSSVGSLDKIETTYDKDPDKSDEDDE